MSRARAAACRAWAQAADRAALGEALGERERALLRDHPARCAECAAESQVWGAFEDLLERAEPATDVAPVPTSGMAPAGTAAARRRARTLRALGLAAACLLATILVAEHGGREDGPRVASAPKVPASADEGGALRTAHIHASVGVFTVDGRPGTPGASLRVGARLATARGIVCLKIDPGIRACLAEQSVLRVLELSATHRRLELLAGRVAAELAPQPTGESFAIDTRAGSATAIGTAFSVEIPGDGSPVITRVTHGVVLVRGARGSERRVTAQRVAAMDGEIMDGEIAALAPAEAQRDRALMEHAREEQPAPAAAEATRAEPAKAQAAPLAQEVRSTSAQRRARAASEDAAAGLLSSARKARARGALDQAAAAYRELFERYGASREAQAARVAYGQLLLRSLADPRGALAAFERYLERGGPLVEEAEYGRICALRALARTAEERAAIANFLRSHAESALAVSLRPRAAELGVN